MDKTETIRTTVRHREGFALMLTLSVLAVIIALTTVLLSYFNEVKADADRTTALIQGNLYYADITSQFNKFKKQKALFEQLYQYPVQLRSQKDTRFAIRLKCEPIAKGVNVNWLGRASGVNRALQIKIVESLFETIAQQYNIAQMDRLKELLHEEIGGGEKVVRKEQSRLEQKNGIISYAQFAKIVARYQLEVDDLNVEKVPWKKYLSFSFTAEQIDAKYSSAELLHFLFDDINLQTIQEWRAQMPRPALQAFIENNGGDYNARKKILVNNNTFLAESSCNVTYGVNNRRYRFTFNYIRREAKHFEFHGQY